MKSPRFRGIDVQLALQNVGDLTLLDDLVLELANTWHDGASRIAVALAEGNDDDAARLAHALGGVAATLSATRIARAAQAFEASLRARRRTQAQTHLRELGSALNELVFSVRGLNAELGTTQRDTAFEAPSTTSR